MMVSVSKADAAHSRKRLESLASFSVLSVTMPGVQAEVAVLRFACLVFICTQQENNFFDKQSIPRASHDIQV